MGDAAVEMVERSFVEDLTLVEPLRRLVRRGELVSEGRDGAEIVEVFLFNDIVLVGKAVPRAPSHKLQQFAFVSALQLDSSLVRCRVTAQSWVELVQIGGQEARLVLHGTTSESSVEWASAFEDAVFGREEAAIRAQLAEGERRLQQLTATKRRIVKSVEDSARA